MRGIIPFTIFSFTSLISSELIERYVTKKVMGPCKCNLLSSHKLTNDKKILLKISAIKISSLKR